MRQNGLIINVKRRNKRMRKPDFRISIGTIKDLLLIALIVIVTWKLISADFSVSFKDLGISDLLSLLLALFAIGLSVAFYIKANEISNMFYDNMYKFTKDNSELLGRMEAGFGEQLRHLDQGYSGLRDKFDNLPLDLGKTREKVEDEKAEVKKLKSEKDQLLNELAARANLQDEEKQELFSRLRESEIKLGKAEKEMRRLQHKLRDADDSEATISGVRVRAVKHTKRRVIEMLGLDDVDTISNDEILNRWDFIREELSRAYINDLKRGGVIDTDLGLTQKGIEFFREVANNNV